MWTRHALASVIVAVLLAGCGSDGVPTVRLSITTHGSLPDPNGYAVTMGPRKVTVGVNADTVIGGLATGAYDVTLSDLAPNCTVNGSNPAQVVVDEGGEASVSFSVSCPGLAVVRVITTSNGWDPDSNGYLVTIGAGNPGRVVANGATFVHAPGSGPQSVTVSDIAAQCIPASTNPTSVLITPEMGINLELLFDCSAVTGTLHIITANHTGGGTVYLNDDYEHPYSLNARNEVFIPRLAPGTYRYDLFGCSFTPDSPTESTVVVGVMTDVTVTVAGCDYW